MYLQFFAYMYIDGFILFLDANWTHMHRRAAAARPFFPLPSLEYWPNTCSFDNWSELGQKEVYCAKNALHYSHSMA